MNSRWKSHLFAGCIGLTLLAGSPGAFAQFGGDGFDGETQQAELHIRVYNVADLISRRPSYPYQGTTIPKVTKSTGLPGVFGMGGFGGGQGGGGGGLGGGGLGGADLGGGGGGGLFQIAPGAAVGDAGSPSGFGGGVIPDEAYTPIDIAALTDVIMSLVEGNSWAQSGEGSGSITALGTTLVISQTEEVHAKIKELLEQLRAANGQGSTLNVSAKWVSVTSDQATRLSGASAGQSPLSAEELQSLMSESELFQGQVSCLGGQTVHVASGALKTVVQGAIPITGTSGGLYQPVVEQLHIGAMLQVTPSLSSDGNSAMVDIHNVVSEWGQDKPPIEFVSPASNEAGTGNEGGSRASAGTTLKLDRASVLLQQLNTTMQLPIGRYTVIGGMTFEHAREDGGPRHIYLLIQVTVNPNAATSGD